eukprot:Tamp_08137.p4 GENE.Tamp_08137~~Tamp_08137.p4  ORF type:complete len:144 (-),score=51.87 Tamp_08137:750-1181(-)
MVSDMFDMLMVFTCLPCQLETAHQDEILAWSRQVEALTQSLREAEASVAGKEREVQEVMQAFEELESESHSQVQQMEAQRQLEKRRFEQQQRAKLGQVEGRFQREQQALRGFVFTTAKSMLSHVNLERALKKVDLYSSDSDSD